MQHQPLTSFPTSTSTSSAGPSTYTQQPTYTPYAPSQQAQIQRKRSTSPVKGDSSSIDGPAGRPGKVARPTPSEAVINFRAEEEAARRQNAGRTYLGINRDQQGKHSDLFGRNFLRDRTGRLVRDQGVTIDDEALAYLSQAAEQRLRALITSSIRAQNHRTQSSHHRPPPFTDDDEEDGGGGGRPMWSHMVTSDVSGVMDALARQNKEVELGFRASRMDRIAREAEMQRLREIREQRGREARGEMVGEEDQVGVGGPGPGLGPSTPRDKPDTSTESTSVTSGLPPAPSTPVFGVVKEKPSAGSTTKKPGKKTKDVSAETAHKMSNLTAMRATGGKMGKYSWLNNTPNVSSPLAGKKRKGINKQDTAGPAGDSEAKGDKINGEEGDIGEAGPSKKSKLSQSTIIGDDPSTPQPKRIRPNGPSRPAISVPARRLVTVHTTQPLPEGGERRMVPDDQAVTAVDVLFALQREGHGRGLGATEEVVWKVQGRAGGVWGKEGYGDVQQRR